VHAGESALLSAREALASAQLHVADAASARTRAARLEAENVRLHGEVATLQHALEDSRGGIEGGFDAGGATDPELMLRAADFLDKLGGQLNNVHVLLAGQASPSSSLGRRPLGGTSAAAVSPASGYDVRRRP
jgi:hypothetical protein